MANMPGSNQPVLPPVSAYRDKGNNLAAPQADALPQFGAQMQQGPQAWFTQGPNNASTGAPYTSPQLAAALFAPGGNWFRS